MNTIWSKIKRWYLRWRVSNQLAMEMCAYGNMGAEVPSDVEERWEKMKRYLDSKS